MSQDRINDSGLTEDIKELVRNGYAPSDIKDILSHRGFNFPLNSLRKWIRENCQSSNSAPTPPPTPAPIPATRDCSNSENMDFSQLDDRWNIPVDLSDTEGVLGAIQRAMTEIHLLQIKVSFSALQAYIDGTGKEPDFRNLEKTFNLYSKVMAIDKIIDLNVALNTLEKHYDLDLLKKVFTDNEELG